MCRCEEMYNAAADEEATEEAADVKFKSSLYPALPCFSVKEGRFCCVLSIYP